MYRDTRVRLVPMVLLLGATTAFPVSAQLGSRPA